MKDFLLTTPAARKLFHECVEDLPILDYHNHLCIRDLRDDRQFRDLTALWIDSDPYKHRAMRICGVPEREITGDAPPREKFAAWARTLPKLIGNPLFHWSMLELKRLFDLGEPLNEANAEYVWKAANGRLAESEFSARGILRRFHVEYAAPCATLLEDLSGFASVPGVVPSLRCDDILELSPERVARLAVLTGSAIDSPGALSRALEIRGECFAAAGCRFADFALDAEFRYLPDDGNDERRIAAFLRNGAPAEPETAGLRSALLRSLGGICARRGWTALLHIGALRRTSSRLRRIAGPAGGYAGIGGGSDVESIVRLLDDWESGGGLPRTFLFPLNPADQASFAVLSGSFPHVCVGPAWWYCDHAQGMRETFETVAAYGVLGEFPGMTTDSRSLPSLVRHEYFRRVFCDWAGGKIERGEFPADWSALRELAQNVCYYNMKTILSNGRAQ